MMPNLDWLARAACAGMDSRAFFANGMHAREQVNEARKVCASCPVRPDCANFAIETGERWGVWGAMSQQELRRKRRRFTSRARTSTRAAA
ncbi:MULTISPECIES: WhiB family transcriptional regulator [unclassified Streptomyces]|uniref:WhiB family transcriptional regulator n=1 Tax=unclassified Streptomyces TaxID=2593676 RepID=UPI0036EC2A80